MSAMAWFWLSLSHACFAWSFYTVLYIRLDKSNSLASYLSLSALWFMSYRCLYSLPELKMDDHSMVLGFVHSFHPSLGILS